MREQEFLVKSNHCFYLCKENEEDLVFFSQDEDNMSLTCYGCGHNFAWHKGKVTISRVDELIGLTAYEVIG